MSNLSKFVPHSGTFEWVAPDDVADPMLQTAISHWQQIRRHRPFPARNDLKPQKIARLLPYMVLLKVIDGGKDFEHRIVGDVMVRAFNVPIQNRRFSEIARDAPLLIEQASIPFRRVVDTTAPVAWRQHAGHEDTNIVFTRSEIVLLPLGSGAAVDHVVGFGIHETRAKG